MLTVVLGEAHPQIAALTPRCKTMLLPNIFGKCSAGDILSDCENTTPEIKINTTIKAFFMCSFLVAPSYPGLYFITPVPPMR